MHEGDGRSDLVQAIDHVAVAVRDADAASGFWITQLDLELVHDEQLPQIGVRLVYLDAGNTLLQLVQPIGPGRVADFLATHGEGLHHVCFAVPSIPDWQARLDGQAKPTIFGGGRGQRACFLLQQPNNVLVELTERQPDDDPAVKAGER